ncbi:fimbrial outer membrane usher protein StdB [Salmonella enterica]|nr:fimbrial outer membrane usher protein StdB [Salmonella enterica]
MKITRLAILITLTFSVLKSQATEFNASLLDSGNLSNVDLTAFSREGYVAPGNYILDIWLNDQPVREQYPVRVVPVAGLDAAVICVTTDMVAMLGLKDKIIHGLKPVTGIPDGQCLELRSADSQVRYSAENQRLTFIIPQAWMRYQDPDWVPPSRWSDGVTAGLLDYSLMVNRYMPQQGETSTSYSLYGTAGFNLGAWRLRSDYQYSRFDSGQGASQSDFYLPQTYLFRALPALRSKLTLGQTYLSSAIFDSFRFAGLTLASDERMLPPSLQGYAPKISGIANSNAQVTVSQNGRILYQTRVSPGPFELPDLSQNISGNLDVSVRESDGSVRTWQVNTASVPFMARQGQVRYKVAAGRPLYGGTHNNSTVSPDFLLGEATWGAFNNTSLYGGLIASTGDYQSAALGIGQNMGLLGALSADVTRSDARLPHGQKQSGYSYRINYAKTFDKTGSTLAFVGYRFSDRHFLSMPEYLQRRTTDGGDAWHEKQSYTVTYSQSVPVLNMSAALSVSRLNYWNAQSNNNYMLSLNKVFSLGDLQGLSASVSFARNQYTGGGSQNQVYATISIPWGDSRQVRGLTDKLPQDRETLFWFNVRGVPPKPEDDNVLQLAMQSQLKLFYRPKAIIRSSSDQPERKLTAERNAGHLTLRNPTPYYITVAWLGADRSHRLSGFREGVMVPPLGNLPLKAVLPAETRTLWVGYIDDYGGLQMNRYTCDALNCAFKDAGATS